MDAVASDTKGPLAVLGGAPAFAEPLHVGRPNLGSITRLNERIRSTLEQRWLTNDGPLVREFESRLCEFLSVRHCIAVANATLGLEILARALDLSGEVLVPAFTFVATAHALAWLGLTPVPCDIDEATHCLDPAAVEAAVSSRTTAILPVHLWGEAAPVDRLSETAERHGLRLVFDAAHAFGCSHRGRMIGGFGDAEVFSFHATKVVNCGEGGAVATSDPQLAERLRLARNFGFRGYDNVVALGTNAKMPELSAALGLTNLESFDRFVAWNRANLDTYRRLLDPLPGLRLLPTDTLERRNHQYVVVEVQPDECPLTRDQLLRVLHAEGVLARRYFFPGLHRTPPYVGSPNHQWSCPVTDRVASRVLVLPTGTCVTERDVEKIARILEIATAEAGLVRAALVEPGRTETPPTS